MFLAVQLVYFYTVIIYHKIIIELQSETLFRKQRFNHHFHSLNNNTILSHRPQRPLTVSNRLFYLPNQRK